MSFPAEIIAKPVWCLYDNTNGQTILKHPFRSGQKVPCPACGNELTIENYRASCCGFSFKTGFGEIHRVEPLATHTKGKVRGWSSLRVLGKHPV